MAYIRRLKARMNGDPAVLDCSAIEKPRLSETENETANPIVRRVTAA